MGHAFRRRDVLYAPLSASPAGSAIAAPFDLTQHIVSYTIIWTIFTAKCGTIRGNAGLSAPPG